MARLNVAIPVFVLYLFLSSRNLPKLDDYSDILSFVLDVLIACLNSWPNVVLGALLAYLISWAMPAPAKPFNLKNLIPFVVGLGQYAWLVAKEMLQSAYQVGKIVLNPKLPIAPGIIAIDSGCQSEAATVLSAYAITLTPGEMVVAIDENGIMYTHTLDVSRSAEASAEAQIIRRNHLIEIVP